MSGSGWAGNDSYWSEAIESRALHEPLAGPVEADVVIAGGGYTSLVAAYHLKKARSELEVVLLEARYVGFGASGRNAGMVLQELHTDRVGAFGARSVRFTYDRVVETVDWIDALGREEGFDCELERCGYLETALHPVHLRRIAAARRAHRELGVELRALDRDAMRATIASERFLGALEHPSAAALHPGKYVAGLKRACQRLGVRIFEGTPVRRVTPGTGVAVETPAGRVAARRLILGLNAYLPESRLGLLRDRAVTLFSFVILTEPLPDALWARLGWPRRQGYSDLRRIHNYVRVTGRRILFGGRVLYEFGLDSPARLGAIYGRLRRELLLTFPCLEETEITHRWCGPVAITWHRTPVIGRAGRGGSVLYALGYSGMGVSLATLSGRVLADMALGDEGRWRDLVYLRDRAWPLPPEPFRYLGFQGSYYAMRLADALDRLM